MYQSAREQPNPLPTKRLTHTKKTGNSTKISLTLGSLNSYTVLNIGSISVPHPLHATLTASWHKQVLGIIQTAASLSSPDF